jgi:hypothetical protein
MRVSEQTTCTAYKPTYKSQSRWLRRLPISVGELKAGDVKAVLSAWLDRRSLRCRWRLAGITRLARKRTKFVEKSFDPVVAL